MRKVLASVALAAALIVPQVVGAAEVLETEHPNTGALSISGGVDFVSAYIFRGYEYQDAGYIYQPYAQLNVRAYDTEDFSITPYIGIWNSIHGRQEPGDRNWWEEDVYGGVDLRAGDLTFGVIYTDYTFPGDARGQVKEVGLKLSYDDTKEAEGVGLPFALTPYVAWYIQTSNENTPDTRIQYAELGVNPRIVIRDTPLSFNFPLAIGFSPDGFFFDDDGSNETVGFLSAGAYLNVALPVEAKFGSWSFYVGATYYYFNADSLQTFDLFAAPGAGEDRDYEVAGKAGIAFLY